MFRKSAISSALIVFFFISVQSEPQRVYDLSNDLIHIEAEDLDYNSKWSLETANAGYTGRGYLKYVGPAMDCWYQDNRGEPYLMDTNGTCQGTRDDRLYVPVYIKTPGLYSLNIHNFHTMAPQHFGGATDFSIWVHLEGNPYPVVVSHGDNAGRWAWLRWGPDYAERQSLDAQASAAVAIRTAGVYEFYIAGRDRGFCVNRISIYRKLGATSFPANYLSTTSPVTSLEDAEQFSQTPVAEPVQARVQQRHVAQVAGAQYDIVGRRVAANAPGAAAGMRLDPSRGRLVTQLVY